MKGSVNATVSGHAAQFPLLGYAPGLHNWEIFRRTNVLPQEGNTWVYPTWEPQHWLQRCYSRWWGALNCTLPYIRWSVKTQPRVPGM